MGNVRAILFPMQDIHPSDHLGICNIAEIDLGKN